MAHLSFQYSKGLSKHLDLGFFCDLMRDTMVKTTYFPVGGIRVRGFVADVISIADGKSNHQFIDMILRMGEGRSVDIRKDITEALYSTAEDFLKKNNVSNPIALSLEVLEINNEFSIKRYNTVHAAISNKQS